MPSSENKASLEQQMSQQFGNNQHFTGNLSCFVNNDLEVLFDRNISNFIEILFTCSNKIKCDIK